MWSNTLDGTLGVHPSALKIRERRAAVLAGNIANAETPNYKARDLDFKQALRQKAGRGMSMSTTHERHLSAAPASLADVPMRFRVAQQPSLDGNTVDAQQEYLHFARNNFEYQASLTLLKRRFSGLNKAFKGQ